MSNHNHSHCNHDLKYCEKCDVCYCTKCDREWGGHTHWTWYWGGTAYWVYTTANDKYTITYTTGEAVTDTNVLSAFNAGYGSNSYDNNTYGNLYSNNNNTYKDVVGCHTNCIGHN